MTNEALKLNAIKTRLWLYYTNVYYKHTYGFFNIDNEI
jgi:hypothetical protein